MCVCVCVCVRRLCWHALFSIYLLTNNIVFIAPATATAAFSIDATSREGGSENGEVCEVCESEFDHDDESTADDDAAVMPAPVAVPVAVPAPPPMPVMAPAVPEIAAAAQPHGPILWNDGPEHDFECQCDFCTAIEPHGPHLWHDGAEHRFGCQCDLCSSVRGNCECVSCADYRAH